MGILAEEQDAQRSRSQGILGQVGKRECREGRTSRLLDMNEIKLGSLASWEHSTQGPLSPGSRNIEAGDGKDPHGGCWLLSLPSPGS